MDKPVNLANPDAIIPINMSTGFYQRLQVQVGNLLDGKTKQQIAEAHQLMELGKVEPGSWQYDYMTTLILCHDFEKGILERGLFRTVSGDSLLQAEA